MDRKIFLKTGLGAALASSISPVWGKSKHQNTPISDYDISDWGKIRKAFPIKSNINFLNNGTMGITPYPVLNAINESFTQIAENARYPHHNNDLETKLATLIGCSADEVGITKNVSEGINHIAWGIPLKKGDEVIITQHEHIGGCAAWMRRSQLDGVKIKTILIGNSAEACLDIIKRAISSKTKVIAVPHIPCTTGQVLPVREICTLAREKGIISVLDGAHPLGMLQFNLKEIGCDYYAGCFHKWMLGPIGTGWMYIRKELIEKTRITHVAAYSVNAFDMSAEPPQMDLPISKVSRYAYGTFSGPHIQGCLAAIDWYHHVGPDRIEKRVKELNSYLRKSLENEADKIEILNANDIQSQGGQLGFRINPTHTTEINPQQGFVNFARKNGVILRYVGENKVDCIRVSTHYYNYKSQIDLLIDLLQQYAWKSGNKR
jgi:selenocysteine lyase/cysteine desulfurase